VINIVDSQIQTKTTLCDQLDPNDIYIIHSEIEKRTTDQDQKKQQVVPIAQITLKTNNHTSFNPSVEKSLFTNYNPFPIVYIPLSKRIHTAGP
jgi:hypothetical protein